MATLNKDIAMKNTKKQASIVRNARCIEVSERRDNLGRFKVDALEEDIDDDGEIGWTLVGRATTNSLVQWQDRDSILVVAVQLAAEVWPNGVVGNLTEHKSMAGGLRTWEVSQ